MSQQTIIMTGCDANFFDFMSETLASLEALGLQHEADIGILDLGLTAEQVSSLAARGYKVVKPGWTLNVPQELRKSYLVGFDARTCLPDHFPGYEVYLWFDADAWAQTREFFDVLVAGARKDGAAIIRENGSGYHRDFLYNKWWYGHMVAAYGPINGLKVAWLPAINAGIYALRADAPHWQIWRRDYQLMIDHRKKLNMDQHAFNASFVLHKLPHTLAPPTCNWICTLSPPHWNAQTKKFVTPDAAAKPLSVLHLAGPDKRRIYTLPQLGGGALATALTYQAYVPLRAA
jgi:hypothetical protein